MGQINLTISSDDGETELYGIIKIYPSGQAEYFDKSENGTYVNGNKIHKASIILQKGDKIKYGDEWIVIENKLFKKNDIQPKRIVVSSGKGFNLKVMTLIGTVLILGLGSIGWWHWKHPKVENSLKTLEVNLQKEKDLIREIKISNNGKLIYHKRIIGVLETYLKSPDSLSAIQYTLMNNYDSLTQMSQQVIITPYNINQFTLEVLKDAKLQLSQN